MFVCGSLAVFSPLFACTSRDFITNWTSLNVCGAWRQWPCNLCKHHRKSIHSGSLQSLFYQLQITDLHELSAVTPLTHHFCSVTPLLEYICSHFKSKACYNRLMKWMKHWPNYYHYTSSHLVTCLLLMHVLNSGQRGCARTCLVIKTSHYRKSRIISAVRIYDGSDFVTLDG